MGILGGQGQSLPGAMYWESCSMNWLTGQLIAHTYSTVGWPGKGLLADKSSAALNKQNKNLIDTQTSETMSITLDNHETTCYLFP